MHSHRPAAAVDIHMERLVCAVCDFHSTATHLSSWNLRYCIAPSNLCVSYLVVYLVVRIVRRVFRQRFCDYSMRANFVIFRLCLHFRRTMCVDHTVLAVEHSLGNKCQTTAGGAKTEIVSGNTAALHTEPNSKFMCDFFECLFGIGSDAPTTKHTPKYTPKWEREQATAIDENSNK